MNIKEYCATCKHKDVKANEHPCDTCMEMGINEYAGKPLAYEVEDEQIHRCG